MGVHPSADGAMVVQPMTLVEWRGRNRSFPHCLLVVCRCTRTHSPLPSAWPAYSFPF